MATFAETVLAASARTLSVTVHAEVQGAIQALGPEAQRPLDALAPERRSALTDQFIRNLRSLAVDRATEVERELFHATGARPQADWRQVLDGPQDLVALRNHIKLVLTSLGLAWGAIARLQAGICMLAGWIQSSGGGTVHVQTGVGGARFRISTLALGSDPALLDQSPMVAALRQQVRDASTHASGAEVVIEFAVNVPA